MFKKIFIYAPVAALMMACGSEPETTTTETPEPEPVIVLSPEEEIQNYLAEKGWEGVRHESGMYVVTDTVGTGDARPTLNDDVTIFYQGYLLDGIRFDGTAEEPATFPLSQLIQGWQIGIPLFGKGGSGKLIIPSDLAYGDEPNGDIPGGSTLMFEIELIDWAPSAPQPGM